MVYSYFKHDIPELSHKTRMTSHVDEVLYCDSEVMIYTLKDDFLNVYIEHFFRCKYKSLEDICPSVSNFAKSFYKMYNFENSPKNAYVQKKLGLAICFEYFQVANKFKVDDSEYINSLKDMLYFAITGEIEEELNVKKDKRNFFMGFHRQKKNIG